MEAQHEAKESALERIQKVFESLRKGRDEEVAAQREGGEAWLEDRIAGLPERAKGEIRAYERKLADSGVADASRLAELVEEKIVAFEQTYQDGRFTVGEDEHMLNKGYAKEQAVTYLKDILGDAPTPEDLKKVALLNFDANGLKAINDLSASHEKGTEYLRRVAEIFYAKESPEALRLKELGIKEILPVTAGGDEYSLLLKSDAPITPEVIEEAIGLYESAIERIDVSDLVDFDDDDVVLRYLGVTEVQFKAMGETGRKKILDEARAGEIPKGFRMRASAPGGGATMYEGMLSALEHRTKPLSAEDSYSRAADKIVGGMWDAADKPALENKNHFKTELRASGASAEDKFYGKVLARTSEARVLEGRLDTLTMELRVAKTIELEMKDLDELYEQELIDDAGYGKRVRELRAKYRAAA